MVGDSGFFLLSRQALRKSVMAADRGTNPKEDKQSSHEPMRHVVVGAFGCGGNREARQLHCRWKPCVSNRTFDLGEGQAFWKIPVRRVDVGQDHLARMLGDRPNSRGSFPRDLVAHREGANRDPNHENQNRDYAPEAGPSVKRARLHSRKERRIHKGRSSKCTERISEETQRRSQFFNEGPSDGNPTSGGQC